MKKYIRILIMILGLSALLTACSTNEEQKEDILPKESGSEHISQETEGSQFKEKKILIAYFTRLDNTEGELDAIIQGGGPYGKIGDSLEDADMDAISSASITVIDGDIRGNTQAVAEMIQEITGGDLFSISTEASYPVDYDALIDAGGEEKNENARPQLKTHVENMQDYDLVFLGFPNWWYDMPMPVYSFLEEYDFSGKTIIPFATSAGSGFSDTVSSIRNVLPDSDITDNGLHIQMDDVADGKPVVEEWLRKIGF